MKNVLVITSSLREFSNSDILAKNFAEGAKSAGQNVEIVSLKNKNIAFCKGCMSCQKTLKCVIKDDAISITEKMLNANVIAFASPIYYYSISGQLKTLLDRSNALYCSDYKFRDIYFLCTAAEDESYTKQGGIKAIQGWVDCFDKVKLIETVFCGGVDSLNTIKNKTAALEYAFKVGASIK